MLWTIAAVLLGLWLIGLVLDLFGGLIYLALVIGLIVLVVKVVQTSGRSKA